MIPVSRENLDRAGIFRDEALSIVGAAGLKAIGRTAVEVCAGLGATRGEYSNAARSYTAAEAHRLRLGAHRDPADEGSSMPLVARLHTALARRARTPRRLPSKPPEAAGEAPRNPSDAVRSRRTFGFAGVCLSRQENLLDLPDPSGSGSSGPFVLFRRTRIEGEGRKGRGLSRTRVRSAVPHVSRIRAGTAGLHEGLARSLVSTRLGLGDPPFGCVADECAAITAMVEVSAEKVGERSAKESS